MMKRWTAVAALGVVSFALYVYAMPPSFAFWDAGELQTVAVVLGIAHPPASPFFVLAGWASAHAVPFGEPAWRVGLPCAAAVAGAVAMSYAIARRFDVSPVVAALGSLAFACSPLVLHEATRVEVQDLSLALRIAALGLALRFYDTGDRRALAAAAFATGLAGATHGIAILLVPSLALLVLARREGRTRASLAIASAFVALGLLPYAYLPLRSAWISTHGLDPTLALGLPAGTSPFWDYDHPATVANFWRVVTAADFRVGSGFWGFLQISRYGSFAQALVDRLAGSYGVAGAALAAVGFATMLASRRIDRIAVAVAAFLPVPFTQSYADLQEADRYYLFSLWCAAIALGIALEALVGLLESRKRGPIRVVAIATLAVAIVVAAPDRTAIFAQRDDRGAEAYVRDVRALVSDGAIVVAEWAYATPLAYDSYVRHEFGTRIVLAARPEQFAADYPRWLRTRALYVISFDESLALPGYRCTALKRSAYTLYRITRT